MSQGLSLDPDPESVSELVANGTLKMLQPSDCISAYSTYYQTTYGSLMLVTDNPNITAGGNLVTQPVMDTSDREVPYAWMCDPYPTDFAEQRNCSLRVPEMQSHPNDWVMYGYKVDYCLAEMLPQTCTLEFSFPLALIVIIANLIKMIVIGVTASYLKCAPLLTTGDAVASFTKRPDEVTEGKCLLSREYVTIPQSRDGQLCYNEKPNRWRSSLSTRRWVACLLSYAVNKTLPCYGVYSLAILIDT